jgi:ABC-type multidrug transport system fused ATPase/permease subunit
MLGILFFGAFVAVAIVKLQNRIVHKRLMLIANVSLIAPALSRMAFPVMEHPKLTFPWMTHYPFLIGAIPLAMILALFLFDLAAYRKVFAATVLLLRPFQWAFYSKVRVSRPDVRCGTVRILIRRNELRHLFWRATIMALTITGLSKTYPNGVKALKNLTLSIGNNMFGLLGPNGAGKSSLMRTIATLQDPDAGSILLDDIDVLNDKPAVRKVLGCLRWTCCSISP